MLTPTNLARLAAWAGISPETHRHLHKNVCQCGSHDFYVMTAGDYDVAYCEDCNGRWDDRASYNFIAPDPTDPAADPQVVDDVWASRLMWTLATSHEWDTEGFDLYLTDTGDYGVVLSPRIYEADLKPANECAPSATLALLLAARAAGVPEIVECMGDEA